MTSNLICQCLSGASIVTKGKSMGLEKILSSLREKKGDSSFVSERTFILERGVALYVPFATVCFVFALDDKRCTLETGEDMGAKKKRKKKDDVKYAHHIWIPVMSEFDAKQDCLQVAWTFSQLTVKQSALKKSWVESSGFERWMKMLHAVAEKQAATKDVVETTKVAASDTE